MDRESEKLWSKPSGWHQERNYENDQAEAIKNPRTCDATSTAGERLCDWKIRGKKRKRKTEREAC